MAPYKILTLFATLLCVLSLVLMLLYYGGIPGEVPIHYTIDGSVSSWGSKSILWYLLGGNILMNAILALLGRHPECYNYPVTITEVNRDRIYIVAARFVALLRLLLTLMVSVIMLMIALSLDQVPPLLFAAIIVAPLLSLIWGVVSILRAAR